MSTTPTQLPLGMGWADTAAFDLYSPGDNADALAATQRATDGGAAPLLLHGPAGSGKSHLLQAAARAAHRAGRSAAYLPLAAYADSSPDVLDGLAPLALVALDECDSVCARPAWAAALARLLDEQRSRGADLLLASRLAPPALAGLTRADLRTRLSACAVFGLRPPTDATLRDALQRRARARGLALDDGVAEFLVRRLPRDAAALMAVLDRLDHASLSAQRRLTIPFVQQTLFVAPAAAPTSARTGSGR